jgi:adenine C2-methylase RlmN of 23S rRNA A2503 and tRNA A37
MGEPLNNYNSVADAIRVMIHPQVFALKQRSITVSTVGVIHRLPAVARDLPGVSLALSLHAPNQQLCASSCPARMRSNWTS